MALWKLEQLKRWWENKGSDGDEGEPKDGEGDEPKGNPGEQGDEGEGGDAEGEGGDEGGDDGEGEGEGKGEGDGGEGEPGTDAPPQDSDSRGKGGGKPLDPREFQNLDTLKEKDVEDPNVTVQNEAGESSTPDGSVPPVLIMDPTEYPILPYDAAAGTLSTQEWLRTLKGIRVSALRLALRRLMQRSDTAGREGSLREGRLGRGVNRLLVGAENVFERRYEVDGESVAVSLLIDRSGSMGSTKMKQAADVALLIGETAQNAGAKLEVVAFDSGYDREAQETLDENMGKDTGDANWRYNGKGMYAEPSAVYVCKTFSQPIGHLRRMYITMCNMSNGGTNDASALKWVGQRLCKQDANRKIVFVIADGMGDPTPVFRHVVGELEAAGVIVIGIGIGCEARLFEARFTHAVAIKSAADLCGKAFGLLIGTIAKARGL